MDFIRNRPEISALIAFLIGLVLGWFVIGWGLIPVQFVDAPPWDLQPDYKATYIETTAIAYSTTGRTDVVENAFRGWPEEDLVNDICAAHANSTEPATQTAIDSMAQVVNNGQGCGAPTEQPVGEGEQPAPPPTDEEEGGTNFMVVLIFLLLIVALLGAIYWILRKRGQMMDDEEPVSRYEVPDEAPTSTEMAEEGVTAVPIARFTSTYNFGRDNYDDSFSIENTVGDFLGECGVGISESIGTNTPKNVTAFEVWLFDKNDIRTETKVLMSDHAFFDEALKAKLAPKGEPVLARESEVIVLETAALIINASVKDMQYGTDDMPPQSYFETVTLEISAWAKEAEAADTVEDSFDDSEVAQDQDDTDALNY